MQLHGFYNAKDIFFEFWAHKKAKAEGTTVGSLVQTELWNVDGPSQQQVIMAVEIRDQAKVAEIDALRDKSDFNFPKIHFQKHLVEHISGYGYLGQYSTEISERAHTTRIKEGWKKLNHVDAIARILKYGDNYWSMMKLKAEIELDMTRPEQGRDKEYPRFCGTRSEKYKDVIALLEQIEVPQLKALLGRYLNLEEDVVHYCHL